MRTDCTWDQVASCRDRNSSILAGTRCHLRKGCISLASTGSRLDEECSSVAAYTCRITITASTRDLCRVTRKSRPPNENWGGGGVVEIGDHVWIGDNAVIVGPITIGRGSIVGANSVVRADGPEFTMVGGIPARALK